MRAATPVATTSTSLFSQQLPTQAAGGTANNLSVTIQNPSSNSDSVEIAWDDVDTPLIAGTGQILAPGDWRNIKSLPVNSAGKAGVLGISLGAGSVTVRVMQGATVL